MGGGGGGKRQLGGGGGDLGEGDFERDENIWIRMLLVDG